MASAPLLKWRRGEWAMERGVVCNTLRGGLRGGCCDRSPVSPPASIGSDATHTLGELPRGITMETRVEMVEQYNW